MYEDGTKLITKQRAPPNCTSVLSKSKKVAFYDEDFIIENGPISSTTISLNLTSERSAPRLHSLYSAQAAAPQKEPLKNIKIK